MAGGLRAEGDPGGTVGISVALSRRGGNDQPRETRSISDGVARLATDRRLGAHCNAL